MNQTFFDRLVCPVTHQPLRYDAQNHELISDAAQLAFPIQDGIPILLPEKARSLAPQTSRSDKD